MNTLGINAYFGQDGEPTLEVQTRLDLPTPSPSNYLYLYDGRLNTTTHYAPYGSASSKDTPTATIITTRSIGYGYSLPYAGRTLPYDGVWVDYVLTIPKDSSIKPTLSVTVSSYDHPGLAPFYKETLTLVSGGVAIL